MATALVASAFGQNTTLYDALNCERTASPAELKQAYRCQALLYHPDKNIVHARAATVKFQAVSAAYQVLMDPRRRRRYDATGMDDEDSVMSHSAATSRHGKRRKKGSDDDQQRWDDFFHSVFEEIIKHNHGDAAFYRGSNQERLDVLQAYETCKGQWTKMVDCILHASMKDITRWKQDIVVPAIKRGEIVGYGPDVVVATGGGRNDAGLVDSDDDINIPSNNSTMVAKPIKGRLSKIKGNKKNTSKQQQFASVATSKKDTLTDTDDEELASATASLAQNNHQSTSTTMMSRKDKMEYRVAKKRKLKAEREMEVANLFQSKTWSTEGNSSTTKRKKWQGAFTDDLISSMEKKYSEGNNNKSRTKKKIKKR